MSGSEFVTGASELNITLKQFREFEDLTRPVIAWLNANCHQHVTVFVNQTNATLSERVVAYSTNDYLRYEDIE